MLELVDIHSYYGESYVIRGVSLKVEKGSVVTLLGRNGMGKTTTIRSIIGFNSPRRGKVIFGGRNIAGLPAYRIARSGIGLVPQGRRIFPPLNVKENLTIAARNLSRTDAWTLDKVYAMFPVLKERASLSGSLLSGGEQQMLAIARALMTNPDLLLMDEPSEGLAPLVIQGVAEIIKQLRKTGISIFLVEQNLDMAMSVSDYFYVLSNGRIEYESSPEVLDANEEVKRKYLGVAI
jgi:branched-chain amino acid transport system ATP-binding protein